VKEFLKKYITNMNNKIICIDFWNTIYDSTNGIERNKYRQRVLVDELDKNGISVLAEDYDRAMKATWTFFEETWKHKHKTPTARECVVYFWKFTGLPFDDESIEVVTKAFEDSVLVHKPKIIQSAKDSIKELSKDFNLAIISDTGFSPGSILKQLMIEDDIAQYFSAFSFSNETGYSKPNENAFNHALNLLNANSSKSFHIGDIEHTDIIGAKKIGMKAIRYSGSITEYTSSRNPINTIADYESDSWDDIYNYIVNNHDN